MKLMILLIALCGFGLLAHGLWLTYRSRLSILKSAIRALRRIRPAARIPRLVLVFLLFAWGWVCVGVAAELSGAQTWAAVSMVGAFSGFVAAGCVSLARRLTRLFPYIWADVPRTVLAASVGAMLTFVAIAIAKRILHEVTGVDPRYLSESVGVVAALIFIPLWGALGLAVIYLLALWQLCIAMVVVYAGPMVTAVPGVNAIPWDVLWYRLQNRRKPPGGRVPKDRVAGVEKFVYALGIPVASTAVVLTILYPLEQGLKHISHLRPYVESAIVWLDYRPNSRCKGVPEDAQVAYLEGSLVSVASGPHGARSFLPASCELIAEVK